MVHDSQTASGVFNVHCAQSHVAPTMNGFKVLPTLGLAAFTGSSFSKLPTESPIIPRLISHLISGPVTEPQCTKKNARTYISSTAQKVATCCTQQTTLTPITRKPQCSISVISATPPECYFWHRARTVHSRRTHEHTAHAEIAPGQSGQPPS